MKKREHIKIVLLGDKMTGKTSLRKRYFSGHFNETELATIGAGFDSRVFTLQDKEYEMEVWDTSGEEKYQSICRMYYRNAAVAILCYDVTIYSTFQKLNYWIGELYKIQESCKIYVCATKLDLLDQYEANPQLNFVESYARENGVKFFLTSSKTGENVVSLFDEILDDYITNSQNTPSCTDTIKLPTNKRRWMKQNKKCC